jgi:hypothetical protein
VTVKEIILCNTGGSDVTVTIKFGVSESELAILSAKTIKAGETKIISMSAVLNAAEVIDGGDNTGGVVDALISGITITST